MTRRQAPETGKQGERGRGLPERRGQISRPSDPVVFETVIPRTTRLAEAPSFGKPIIYYDKYSTGAAAYEVLTQEVLGRLKS